MYASPLAFMAITAQSASIFSLFGLVRSGHCPLPYAHIGDMLVGLLVLCKSLEHDLFAHNTGVLQVRNIVVIAQSLKEVDLVGLKWLES